MNCNWLIESKIIQLIVVHSSLFHSISTASTIRQLREIDEEKLNDFTIKNLESSNSSSKKDDDTISSVNNNISNLSVSHAYGYQPDDRTIINSGAHSLPVVAPAQPKSKYIEPIKWFVFSIFFLHLYLKPFKTLKGDYFLYF